MVAIAFLPKLALGGGASPHRRTGHVLVRRFARKILQCCLPNGRALASGLNFSQVSLCSAFQPILEVFFEAGTPVIRGQEPMRAIFRYRWDGPVGACMRPPRSPLLQRLQDSC